MNFDLNFKILDGFDDDFLHENFDENFDMVENSLDNHDDKILLHEDLIIDGFVNKFVDNDVYHDFDKIDTSSIDFYCHFGLLSPFLLPLQLRHLLDTTQDGLAL